MIVKVTADISCSYVGGQPAYRLWLNDQLLTERHHPGKNCTVRENIIVEIESGIHEISIESVGYGAAKLSIDNVVVNNIPAGCKFRV